MSNGDGSENENENTPYAKKVKNEVVSKYKKSADKAFDVGTTISSANDAAIKLNTALAGSGALAATITTNFVDAGQKMLLLTDKVSSLEEGMQMAADVNKNLMDATGRAYIASSKELAGIVSAQQASGVEASKLLTAFKSQGYALEGIPKTIQKVIDTSRALGVNSEAVTSSVVTNLGKLNTFNFANGVEGLTRMAAQAAVVGVDMQKMFSLADDMFDPEKAVGLASSLQRLGVATGDLLDPLKLMDLGQNNPQELQNQIVQMSKQFTYFNEQNQKFEILPGAKLQLREIAKEMGMSADELAKMALGSSDLSKKMSEIKFPELETGPVSEDQKMMLANLAELKDGEYKIKVQETVLTEKGERVATGKVEEKSIAQLSKEDLESLQFAQQQGTKTLEQIALESMSYEARAANALESISSTGRGTLASSKIANKGQEVLGKTLADLVNLTKEVSTEGGRGLVDEALPLLRDFGAKLSEAYKDSKISEDEKTLLMEKGKEIDEKFGGALGKGAEVFSKLGNIVSEFPGEVIKAVDAATKTMETEKSSASGDKSGTASATPNEPKYLTTTKKDEMMQGIFEASRAENTSVTNNTSNQSVNNSTYNNQTSSNTNNSITSNDNRTTNTNSTTINESQKATAQLNTQPLGLDLQPMVDLQNKQLLTSEGSLGQLQELNLTMENGNQELIKVLSSSPVASNTANNILQTPKEILMTNQPTDNTKQLVVGGQSMTENKIEIQKPTDILPVGEITNSMAQNNMTPQGMNSSFDGKLTIDVNITAPPGVDIATIKDVVTKTMYDSKVRDNINKSVISPRIGANEPTSGIPV
jgi:hypothetical protein